MNVDEGDQWLVYDLGAAVDLAQVCVRWSTRDGWTIGARGVRVDVSDDGVAWTEGRVYTEADGLPPPLELVAEVATETINATIRDSDCFDVDAATASFVRLWFGEDDNVMIPKYLGIAEVAFRPTCDWSPPSPTMSPSSWYETPAMSPSMSERRLAEDARECDPTLWSGVKSQDCVKVICDGRYHPRRSPQRDCAVVVDDFVKYGGNCQTYCGAQQGGILYCVAHYDDYKDTCQPQSNDLGCDYVLDVSRSSDNICVCGWHVSLSVSYTHLTLPTKA